ncbi:MAG: OmpP1/FadL family transporter [Labilibaculum antarcticum]
MKRYTFLLILSLIAGTSYSQSVDNALKYSRQEFSGTARSTAMGGAFGALGGDFSSLSINPGGIGVYRSSEFTFTPSIEYTESKNSGFSEDKYSFTMGNVGYVATFIPRMAPEKGWQNFNFGIGYNRIANFNREGYLFNLNSETSLLDRWASLASGESDELYPFEEKLAYDTYLININDEGNYQAVLFGGDRMDQQKRIDEKGYIGEYVLSFGANYGHKLYLGATVGIQDLYYKSTTSYSEYSLMDNITSLNEFTFSEYMTTSGVGVNLKFGAIYKVTNSLRLGAAIHTPTFYNLEEKYYTSLSSTFEPSIPDGFPEDGEATHSYYSADINNNDLTAVANYDFETPFRTILSAAYLFGKKAILSVDYEMIDYSNNEFNDSDVSDSMEDNQKIADTYQSTSNLRIGAEYRITPNFSLRGGYAKTGDPYKSAVNEGYDTYSGGFGIKQNNFFFDMAYQYKEYNEDFLMYDGSPDEFVRLNNTNHQVRMTFGFKF